jgi:hypothetical protein
LDSPISRGASAERKRLSTSEPPRIPSLCRLRHTRGHDLGCGDSAWASTSRVLDGQDILTRPWDRTQFAKRHFALGRGAREGVYPQRSSTSRATKPQGKRALARRVAAHLASGVVARRVIERCGYTPLRAPSEKPNVTRQTSK